MRKLPVILLISALNFVFPYRMNAGGGEIKIMRQKGLINEIKRDNRLNQMARMIAAIEWCESRQNRLAYNINENAAGILQIRPVMIAEANRLIGWEKYTLSDRFDVRKSRELFILIQTSKLNDPYNLDSLAHVWNCGSNDAAKLKKTMDYRDRVRRTYELSGKKSYQQDLTYRKYIANIVEIFNAC